MATSGQNQAATLKSKEDSFQPISIHVKKVHAPDLNDPSKNYFEAVFDGEQKNPNAQVFRVRMNFSDNPIYGKSMAERLDSALKGGGRAPCSFIDASKEAFIRSYEGKSFVCEKPVWNTGEGFFEVRWLKRLGNDPLRVIKGPSVAEVYPDKRYDGKLRLGMLHVLKDAIPLNDPSSMKYIMKESDEHFKLRTMPRGTFHEEHTDREIIVSGQQMFGVILLARDSQGQVIDFTDIQNKYVPNDDAEYPPHFNDKMKYYQSKDGSGLKRQALPLDSKRMVEIIHGYKTHINQTYGEGFEILAIPVDSFPGSFTSPPLSREAFDRNSKMPPEPIEALYKERGFTCTSLSDIPVDGNGHVMLNSPVKSATYGLVPFNVVVRQTEDQTKGIQKFINNNVTISYPIRDDRDIIKTPVECVKDPNGEELKLHPNLKGLIIGRNNEGNFIALGHQGAEVQQPVQQPAQQPVQQPVQQPAAYQEQQQEHFQQQVPPPEYQEQHQAQYEPNNSDLEQMMSQLDQFSEENKNSQQSARSQAVQSNSIPNYNNSPTC